MRQGQQNRRGRGRTNGGGSNNSNNNGGSNSSNNNNHNNGRKPQNPLSRNYESSGPDVKIRGTAAQIAEKYTALARDASAASDVIMVENYLQHAEHYNRIIMAAQAQQQQVQQQPSLSSHHVQENGHERGHGNSLPQRISPDANGAMRDQPQPVITFEEAPAPVQEVAVEQPEPAAPPPTPAPTPRPAPRERAAKDDSTREEAPRRRRRRYPAGGTGDRAATGPDDANGAEGAKEVAKSDRPADEAIA